MAFPEELSTIYKKSLSLKELLGLYSPGLNQNDSLAKQEKMEKWCQLIAEGDKNNFQKRFLWNGINSDQVNALFVDHTNSEETKLPGWINTLQACLETAYTFATLPEEEGDHHLVDPAFPLPFEKVLIPFVRYARETLKNDLSETYHFVGETAHRQLEQCLLAWLSYLNALPMQAEFSAFRAARQSSLKRIFKSQTESLSKEAYQTFTHSLLAGGLRSYFTDYAVLAKLMATGIKFWIEATTELISRFEKDKPKLEKIFNDGNELGAITDIKPSLSDRHNKGRSVMVLKIASGVQLVYKPRNIGIEKAYNELIEYLNLAGSPIKLKTFNVFTQADYGWAEFVPTQSLENTSQAQTYYKRVGGLLCLVYVLGATDLHYENLIGQCEQPVLIDLETLLHPFVNNPIVANNENARAKAVKLINSSVIRTGLLPRWQLNQKDQAYDVSGLGEFMTQTFNIEGAKWMNVNTDSMHLKKESISFYGNSQASDSSKGDGFYLSLFLSDIVAGFSETYHFLMQNRDSIVQSPCWNALSSQTLRFIFRPTKVYAQIERHLLYPSLLKNGLDRSIHLDMLYKGMTSGDFPPLWWPLVEAEQEAMERMDIPHFSIQTDSHSLDLLDGKQLCHYFTEPSFQAATGRLKHLDEQDLKQQIELIRGTILCRIVDKSPCSVSTDALKTANKFYPLTTDKALEVGISIAQILKKKAIVAYDGSITWIAPQFYPTIKKYQLEPISNTLYDGTAGIGLFFGGLFKLTECKEFRTIALGALQIPSHEIEESTASGVYHTRVIGGFSGQGGLIYSFLKAGLLLEEPTLIDTARKAAFGVTKKAIDQDTSYNVMDGVSGLLLSLLTIYEYSKDEKLLTIIIHCGDHLLKSRKVSAGGYNGWPSENGAFLTGFSHGAAGIAYALLRIFKLTNEIRYRDAALEAIAYENSVFDLKEGNWPDFRSWTDREEKKFGCSWCHGAAGIGLARLATLDILDTVDVRRDIQVAVETSKKWVTSAVDHVCCGNFGRLELLFSAAKIFSDEPLHTYTLDKAGELVSHWEKHGDFRYNPAIGFTPGFFQGLSGIGYQILRITNPETLPPVLTLN